MYLTADATETLEALDPGTAYIIGGIVDRNRYKRLCQEKAEKQGLRTARLPIDAHLKLAGTRVLTVNQVVAILVHWQVRLCSSPGCAGFGACLLCPDWRQAAAGE